jgi:hypothetical protein
MSDASGAALSALFAAARDDAPDPATHDAMWNGVANATGIAATATVAAVATSTAKPAAAAAAASASLAPKLLLVGALIGAVGAAMGGVAALGWMESNTGVTPEAVAPVAPSAPITRSAHVPARGATLADSTPRARDPLRMDRPISLSPATSVSSVVTSPSSAMNTNMAGGTSGGLAEEARLVTEARAALVAGDPARALALLRVTHRFANRALEPEELSLEARALRAAGRVDEAVATELTLKARFPNHALSR